MNINYLTIKVLLLTSLLFVASCENSTIAGDTGISLDSIASKFTNAITGLTVNDISISSYTNLEKKPVAELSWVPLPFTDYYRLHRDINKNGSTKKLISDDIYKLDGQKIITFKDIIKNTEDQFNRTHYYWLEACSLKVGCIMSRINSVVSWPTGAPENLTTKVSLSGEEKNVILSWTPTTSSIFTEIYRGSVSDHNKKVLIKRVRKENVTSFVNTNVPPSTYYYWVKSCNNLGCSKESKYADIIVGNSSGGLITEVKGNNISITWDPDDSSPGVYNLYRSTDNDLDGAELLLSNNTENSFKSEISPGTYYYWLKKCNGSVCTDGGDGIKVNVLENPSIQKVGIDDGNVVIKLNKPLKELAKGSFTYIYRGVSEAFYKSKKIATLSGSEETEYTDNVDSGKYYYWVKSCNESGCTDPVKLEKEVLIVEAPNTPPIVDLTTGSPIIKTNGSQANANITFSIFRADTPNLSTASKIGEVKSNDFIGYKDNTLTRFGNYYYWLKSCSPVGCSKAQGPEQISSLGSISSTIRGIVEDGTVVLSWKQDFVGSKIMVFRSNTKDNKTAKKISDIQAKSEIFTDPDVISGDKYYYWLKNCVSNICSGYSNVSNELIVPEKIYAEPILSLVDDVVTIKSSISKPGLVFTIFSAEVNNLSLATEIGKLSADNKKGKSFKLYSSGNRYYWLKNCNNSGCSAPSKHTKINFTVPKEIITPIIVSLENNIMSGKVILSWTARESLLKTLVYRSKSTSFDSAKIIKTVAAGKPSYYEDEIIEEGTYYYWVKNCLESGKCSKNSSRSEPIMVISRPSVKLTLNKDSFIRFGKSRLKANSGNNETYSLLKGLTDDIYKSKYSGDISNTIINKGVISDGETYYYWVNKCNKDRTICSIPSTSKLKFSVPNATTASLYVKSINRTNDTITFGIKGYSKSVYAWGSNNKDSLTSSSVNIEVKNDTIKVDYKKIKHLWLSNCEIGLLVCSSAGKIEDILELLKLPKTKLSIEQLKDKVSLKWGAITDASSYIVYYNNTNDPSTAKVLSNQLSSDTSFKTKITGTQINYYWVKSCINAKNCSDNSNVVVASTARINDTAIYLGFKNIDVSKTPSRVACNKLPANKKQDCSYGRDVKYPDNSNGTLGYDFTKLDSSGNAINNSAKTWSCVRDNVTGLVWENKNSEKGNVHNYDNVYEWNKWSKLIDTSNTNKLCGYSDWRVADTNELIDLLNFDEEELADKKFFPIYTALGSRIWWSFSNKTIDFRNRGKGAMSVNMIGNVEFEPIKRKLSVRLVRGPRSYYWGEGRYKINNDGTATDLITGLTWKRCSEGQSLKNNSCTGTKKELLFDDAMIEGSTSKKFAGKDNWRIPNYKELSTLMNFSKYNYLDNNVDLGKNSNQVVFPGLSGMYLSSSIRGVSYVTKVVLFHDIKDTPNKSFISGNDGSYSKSNIILVRDE